MAKTFSISVPDAAAPVLVQAIAALEGVDPATVVTGPQQAALAQTHLLKYLKQVYANRKADDARIAASAAAQAEIWP